MQNQGRCYELFSPVPVLIGQRTSTPIENIYLDSDYRTENEEQITMNGEENPVLTNTVEEVPLRYQFQACVFDKKNKKTMFFVSCMMSLFFFHFCLAIRRRLFITKIKSVNY